MSAALQPQVEAVQDQDRMKKYGLMKSSAIQRLEEGRLTHAAVLQFECCERGGDKERGYDLTMLFVGMGGSWEDHTCPDCLQ